MKNKTVHTSNETVIVPKIVETKILAIGKAVHCCAFIFLVWAMVNYRSYELYSLRTIHRFCSRMEREDNVILIVIKHHLGVRNI